MPCWARKKIAGNRRVNGTVVTAPMRETKSVKKGMALATTKAETETIPVKQSQRREADQFGKFNRLQVSRSRLLHSA